MMKVLAIGNSFSQDATRYLRKIAQASGEDMKVVNLYIGGCPLSRHFKHETTTNEPIPLSSAGKQRAFPFLLKTRCRATSGTL